MSELVSQERRPNWRLQAAAVLLSVSVGLTAAACSEQREGGNAGTHVQTAGEKSAIRVSSEEVRDTLGELSVKGRAPKTGYSREQFGGGWESARGCDTRNAILRRDLVDIQLDGKNCHVLTGILQDPYTGKTFQFTRGAQTSSEVQIDHVVALGDAWQKGAQQWSDERREDFANDPLELWAVDGRTNAQKQDSDAASWLPPNRSMRCTYVAKQVLVKDRYDLSVTAAEKGAMEAVLATCPGVELAVVD